MLTHRTKFHRNRYARFYEWKFYRYYSLFPLSRPVNATNFNILFFLAATVSISESELSVEHKRSAAWAAGRAAAAAAVAAILGSTERRVRTASRAVRHQRRPGCDAVHGTYRGRRDAPVLRDGAVGRLPRQPDPAARLAAPATADPIAAGRRKPTALSGQCPPASVRVPPYAGPWKSIRIRDLNVHIIPKQYLIVHSLSNVNKQLSTVQLQRTMISNESFC